MTDDVLAWLREQLDADERVARLPDAQDWRYATSGVIVDRDVDGWQSATDAARIFTFVDPDRAAEAQHAVLHDPERALRQVAAHRAILDEYDAANAFYTQHRDAPAGEAHGLFTAIKHLAAIYADRHGYRDEWRPDR